MLGSGTASITAGAFSGSRSANPHRQRLSPTSSSTSASQPSWRSGRPPIVLNNFTRIITSRPGRADTRTRLLKSGAEVMENAPLNPESVKLRVRLLDDRGFAAVKEHDLDCRNVIRIGKQVPRGAAVSG